MADQLPSPGLRFTNIWPPTVLMDSSAVELVKARRSLLLPSGLLILTQRHHRRQCRVLSRRRFLPRRNQRCRLRIDSGAGDYQLLPTSALHNAGTDGADIGIDANALQSGPCGQRSSATFIPPTRRVPKR